MGSLAGATSDTPKTSVIVPVHNTASLLDACLDSVLRQTQREIEVIVVDDGSTDESLEVCLALAAQDERIRVVQQENQGPGAARNRGLALARGEYVYFLDSDDIIDPDLLDTCYRACKAHDLDVATFDSRCILNDPATDQSDFFRYLRSRSDLISKDVMDGPTFWDESWTNGILFVMCWLNYINRSFMLAHGLWFREGIFYEDNEWYVRLCMSARRMQYLPRTMHRYRHRPGSITHSEYSYDLARSALEVHKALCALARATDDPVLLAMIGNTCHLHQQFILKFAAVTPTERFKALVEEFLGELLADCHDLATPEAVRDMHLVTLTSLADGVIGWPDQPFVLNKELLQRVLGIDTPALKDATRVGIYGTGNACKAFLWLYEPSPQDLFFLETDAPSDKVFRGRPVTRIADAISLNLDIVVITSSRHRDQMTFAVRRHLGTEMPVVIVPRCVLSMRDDPIVGLVEHGTMRRAWRRLRKALPRCVLRAWRHFANR